MRAELVDLTRYGKFEGALSEEGVYLVLPGRSRFLSHQWLATLDQGKLLTLLDQLRYKSRTSGAERQTAFEKLSGVVTDVLGDVVADAPNEMTQFDLVLRAAELAALPFEAAITCDGEPLFIRSEPRAIITRRVRKEGFRETAPKWPVVPRVLYAWAEPEEEVPWEAHTRALKEALRPWIEPLDIEGFGEAVPDPDPVGVLTILPRASLRSIKEVCARAAANERPFSHVHLLAHGCTVGDGLRIEFGLALHDSDDETRLDAVGRDQLVDALCNEGAEPTVVTLAACDSGNITNPIVGSSIAQQLHTSGIPVVIGSQLPLTVEGSNIFVERFYQSLFGGEDVRCALHDARVSLWDRRADGSHDWMSVVGYIQLPEGYADMLGELRLEAQMASLKTARRWFDFIIERSITDPRAFSALAVQLEERIAELTSFLESGAATVSPPTVAENRGLLGSAEKRRAELLWLRSAHDDPAKWRHDARAALEAARDWYRAAFRGNPAAHWSAVQYLSLEAVLKGEISPQEWHAATFVAELDDDQWQPYWKHGSLAELYLLAPKAGLSKRLDESMEQLAELRRLVPDGADAFPVTSTRLQFMRYVTWWTSENGFFDGGQDLAGDATMLINQLD